MAGAPHHAAEAAVNIDLPAQVGLEPLHLRGEVQEEVASLQEQVVDHTEMMIPVMMNHMADVVAEEMETNLSRGAVKVEDTVEGLEHVAPIQMMTPVMMTVTEAKGEVVAIEKGRILAVAVDYMMIVIVKMSKDMSSDVGEEKSI